MKKKKEKRDFDQNIGLHEVFLESVPTTLIITVILMKAGKNQKYNILIIFVTSQVTNVARSWYILRWWVQE